MSPDEPLAASPMSPALDTARWKRTTTYQIYPRSFADANGDGIGDFAGIRVKLDYLQWLGVETLWLSPFFESSQVDFGHDVSDYYAIAPEYGTMDDCHALIREVHARGMKIVFDMVLNHTSDRHPWFLDSRSSRDSPKRDFYIWRDGRRGKNPPNNWRSMLGGSGWHHDARTGQWCWASFLGFQPGLNYRRPEVKAARLDTVRHWLAEGMDGLRLDIFNAIFKGRVVRRQSVLVARRQATTTGRGSFTVSEVAPTRPSSWRRCSSRCGPCLSSTTAKRSAWRITRSR
jgi:oligo-1,6-glucosidase/alpha-glucosidase